MALDSLSFNEGKDYVLNNAMVGRTVYIALSTKLAVATQLNGGVTLPTGTVTVDDTSTFPSSGNFVTFGQTVAYTGKTGTTFTGCTGGTGAIPSRALVMGTTGFLNTDTQAGGVGEITGAGSGGTAYARKSVTLAASTNGIITLSAVSWNPGNATDWSSTVRSAIMLSAVTAGTAITAWNLDQTYSMAVANATLNMTLIWFLQNIGAG